MSEPANHLRELVGRKEYAAALKFLNSCSNTIAREQLEYSLHNALMLAAEQAAPAELIRAMVEKKGCAFNYINKADGWRWTAAMRATNNGNAGTLDLLLTLGADPKRCRKHARALKQLTCLTVLDRFEERTTLACCLRHYDDLHIPSPLVLHPGIAALSPFAKILHDLHGINGESHDLSRMILSYI
jgi:hypothetical protein